MSSLNKNFYLNFDKNRKFLDNVLFIHTKFLLMLICEPELNCLINSVIFARDLIQLMKH